MDPRHKMFGLKKEEQTPRCTWRDCPCKADKDYKGWASYELNVYCTLHREMILNVMDHTRHAGRHSVKFPCYG